MKLLLLGGTSDALKLCQLVLKQHDVIYSIKGLVRTPKLDCNIHTGGFGGVQGLIHFLQQQQIDCLLDATHPYAINISYYAKRAAQYCHLPCFHYMRPAWQQQSGDNWILFKDELQLTQLLNNNHNKRTRFFFTTGRLSSAFIAKKKPQHHYIIRSIIDNDTQGIQGVQGIQWIKDKGPFTIENERKLFENYQIDALISKNSGGQSVYAKIQIAREMKLPVYLLQRPKFQSDYPIISSINEMLVAVNS